MLQIMSLEMKFEKHLDTAKLCFVVVRVPEALSQLDAGLVAIVLTKMPVNGKLLNN